MGVLDIVGSFTAILKVSGSNTLVDSKVFKLHYRWTATLFFLSAAFVTASEFMGDPIVCIVNGNSDDDSNFKQIDAITTYCWISATYTVNTTATDKELQGIGNKHGAEKRYHAYYQWVPFVLFMMGCLFYLPHMVWKNKEGKVIHNLLQGLHRNALFEKDTDVKIDGIVKYMNASAGCNNHYFTWYMVCEALNLVNIVGNMCLLDKFVGGVFWEYGLKVISLMNVDEDKRDDPMKHAFPRITQCSFHIGGYSGNIENKEMICILPQNIMNEKIFFFLWLWMVILTSVTVCWIVWRVVVLLQPTFRLKLVDHALNNDVSVRQCIQQMHLGDFCLLEALSKNLDIDSFKGVLTGMSEKHGDGRVG